MKEVPSSCYDCELNNYHFCDLTGNCIEQNRDDSTRADDCPLKEVPSGIATKKLEEMYDSYEKHLWREREDVRGDDMVEMGTALQLLQEELCLLGCWDDNVAEEQQGEQENGNDS